MKKFYLMALAAMSVMAMVSCSDSDEPNAGLEFSKTAINFDSYLGRDVKTRASVTSEVKDFGVFAFYTGNSAWKNYASKDTPNFMDNQQVKGTKSNDKSWSYTYTPIKYWPNNVGDKLSFFAYSPYDANAKWNSAVNGQEKYGYLTYTVPADIKKQYDFLACLSSDKTIDLVKQNNEEKIQFEFKHTLSRIGFKVAYVKDANSYGDGDPIDANTTIKVVSVKIGDAAVDGSGFYTTGNLNFCATGQTDWKNCKGNQAYTLNSDNFVENVADKVTDEYQDLNTESSYIMTLPQDFSAKGLPIQIVYTVTTPDDKLTGKSVTVTNTIKNVVKVDFIAGKAYTFKLLLGLTSVKTTASVGKWDTSTDDTTVNLPLDGE